MQNLIKVGNVMELKNEETSVDFEIKHTRAINGNSAIKANKRLIDVRANKCHKIR